MRLLFTLTLLSSFCFGQKSLIVAEYQKDKSENWHTYLVSYHYKKGNFISKDTLYTAAREQEDRYKPSFDYNHGSFIYKDRYLVSTARGHIFDLKTRAIILPPGDDFLKVSGDSIFFYRNNRLGTGLLAFDLKTNSYSLLNQDKIEKDKSWSPDQKNYFKVVGSNPLKIELYKKDGLTPEFVIDAGTGPYFSANRPHRRIVPYWLDNRSLLYTTHTVTFPPDRIEKPVPRLASDTSTRIYEFVMKEASNSEVRIFQYDIVSQKSELIAKIDSVGYSFLRDMFSLDGKKQLIYRAPSLAWYQLNVRRHKISPYLFTELGYDFSVENKNIQGYTITYKGQEIGRSTSRYEIYAAKKFIATPIRAGLGIWNAYTRKWSSHAIPKRFDVIGWTDH